MLTGIRIFLVTGIFLLIVCNTLQSQNIRTQYPAGLKNSYFGVNIGYIHYAFSAAQAEPGFQVREVQIPHAAVRIVLYGVQITPGLSARITYMRPVKWVQYIDVNGNNKNHSVWMNIAGLTVEGKIPLIKNKLSLTAEGGLGIITRNGFEINGRPVVKNANYATGLFGASLQYHISPKWNLQIHTAWSPKHKTYKQPQIFFIAPGFNYYIRPLPSEKAQQLAASGYSFPKHYILAGFTTNALGYGVNNVAANRYFPVFWGGDAHIKAGFSISYHRNIFHTRKVFALDWAAHAGLWKSRRLSQQTVTLSIGPVFKFFILRKPLTDVFFEYSVAGPTFMSKAELDNIRLGGKFTFHDFMGIGMFTGKGKKLYAGIRIAHYSNGNLFPENDGVKVPLTFNLGYVLDK
ncbi:MAG: acyloxyacyl hydrolase [Chitinophagaceae bacterium]|nr:acyloxyacyl hydrolase [Chitinophagaceae bacterium]